MQMSEMIQFVNCRNELDLSEVCSKVFRSREVFQSIAWYTLFIGQSHWFSCIQKAHPSLLPNHFIFDFENKLFQRKFLKNLTKADQNLMVLDKEKGFVLLNFGFAYDMINIALVQLLDVKKAEVFWHKNFNLLKGFWNLFQYQRSLQIIDSLTKTYNAFFFQYILDSQIAQMTRLKKKIVLLYLDLDNFREINKQFSHSEGSNILMQVGQLLKAKVRKNDYVIRMGGDEFLILIQESNIELSHEQAFKIADRIRVEIACHSFYVFDFSKELQKKEIELTVSIGIHHLTPDEGLCSQKLEQALRESNFAMHHAKKTKNQIVSFHEIEKLI